MDPAEAFVGPCGADGGAGGEEGVEGAWDGGTVVVAGYVWGEGVCVGILVPGPLNEVFLALEGQVPDVAGCC